MPRPTTKLALIQAANDNYAKLMKLIDGMTAAQNAAPFDFSDEPSRKEAHWKRDKNVRDVLAHLYEWHQLLLKWVAANEAGERRPFLPEPYNWKTYGEMNVALWRKHQATDLADIRERLNASHRAALELLDDYSDAQLFTKGIYPWTGGSALGSYFVSCTSSHYDWAIKKLKAHIKRVPG